MIVTGASVEYEGSLTLDPDLIDAAQLFPYERVEVNAVYGKDRLVTYVIPGKCGTGQVEMNGGMANFFGKGDKVHVNCFCYVNPENPFDITDPIIVKTDENNKIID